MIVFYHLKRNELVFQDLLAIDGNNRILKWVRVVKIVIVEMAVTAACSPYLH